VSPSSGGGDAHPPPPEMKKEKQTRCDTPDFMAELNGDSCSDETAADLANLERFISEDTSDGIINADTFKDLISEIHDLPPEFMEEFDFGTSSEKVSDGSRTVDSIVSRLKQEEVEAADREIQAAMLDIGKQMASSSSSSSTTTTTTSSTTTSGFNSLMASSTPCSTSSQQQHNRMPQFNNNQGPPELSPAALTLKQMAEQHQHKAQMGMTPAAMQTPSTGLSAPPTMPNQGAPMVPPQQQQQQQHMQPGNNNMRNNTGYPGQQYNQYQQQQQHGRPPYAGQGGYGPNSPMMIKKEGGYFPSSSNTNSPLMGGHSPGPGRPVQQQPPCSSANSNTTIPGAKSSPIPMSQSSPLTPQQQFNARKAPTPTNNRITPPPSNVQFSQTQQQQMQMNMNGQQIQVKNLFLFLCHVILYGLLLVVYHHHRERTLKVSYREP